MAKQPENKLVQSAAKQACHQLAFVMENTNDENFKSKLEEIIRTLCEKHSLVVFGLLP